MDSSKRLSSTTPVSVSMKRSGNMLDVHGSRCSPTGSRWNCTQTWTL